MPTRSKDYKFKFSFVMPIYNVEKYLAETIESILAQDMDFEENCQIVFVNDGSPDNSEEVCLRYQQQFPNNIQYIKQKNQGVSAARNNGIAQAEGKYISLIDPDDKLSPDTLSEIYNFFEKHQDEIDFVSIKLEFFGTRDGEHPLNYKFSSNRVVDITKDIQDVQLSGATAFFASRVFKKNGHKFDPAVGHFGEDMKLMAEVVLDKMAYGVVSKPTYYYRKRGDESALGSATLKKFWYLQTPDVLHKHLISYAKSKSSSVPRYTQFLLMYDLQWRFKQSAQQILSEKELKHYKSKLYKLLKYIDDDIILLQRNITLEHKLFILGKKHGVSILEKAKKRGWSYSFNEIDIYNFEEKKPPVSIEFFEPKGDKIKVEGYFNSFLFSGLELVFHVGRREFRVEPTKQPHKQKRFLGEMVYDRNCFEVTLPIESSKHIRVSLKAPNEMMPLKVRPMIFSGFAYGAKRAYRVIENKLILKTAFGFKVFSYSRKLHFMREIIFLRSLLQAGQYGSVARRVGYYLLKLFKNKKIWIISDRVDAAGDNGEALFRYISAHKPKNTTVLFAISKSSPDYRYMKQFGKVINRDGWLYKLVFMQVDKVISSHADIFVTNPYGIKRHYVNDLLKFDFIFLQHGVTKDDMSDWLNRWNKNIKLFVTAARPEYESILHYDYGYSKREVVLSGFPRYDLLDDRRQRKLIIAPTWRKYLAGSLQLSTAKREYNEAFTGSEYFNFYQNLINDKRVIEALSKQNMTGEFYLHPALSEHVNDFRAGDRFSIKSVPYDYKTAFAEGDLMVTDFSSVAFDFAYLRKPVIYSQFDFAAFYKTQWNPGYFSYERDGFGPVCFDYEDTIKYIVKYIEENCRMPINYQKRVDNFFQYTDKNNSKRVAERILKP